MIKDDSVKGGYVNIDTNKLKERQNKEYKKLIDKFKTNGIDINDLYPVKLDKEDK